MKREKKTIVRLGIVGLGWRGRGMMRDLLQMDDVEVAAVCEVYEDRLMESIEQAEKWKQGKRPAAYTDVREMLEKEKLDGVYIATGWETHVRIAIMAMKAGTYAAVECGGADSVHQCWELVRTFEETGMPCMYLENDCYKRHNMMMLRMIKEGVLGELIHARGGYGHDLREQIVFGHETRHYRLDHYMHRNGEMYPQHILGPFCKFLNINRGNRLMYLISMSSKARGLREYICENPKAPQKLRDFEFAQGDIVNTLIKCAHGETILLNYDTTLPRPGSKDSSLHGTKGAFMEDGNETGNKYLHIHGESEDQVWDDINDYYERYEHPVWRTYQSSGTRGGHWGIDFLVLRAFVESIKNGTDTPLDTYDSATLLSITPLSEQSAWMGGTQVPIPDFTDGRWINREAPLTTAYSLDVIPEEAPVF